MSCRPSIIVARINVSRALSLETLARIQFFMYPDSSFTVQACVTYSQKFERKIVHCKTLFEKMLSFNNISGFFPYRPCEILPINQPSVLNLKLNNLLKKCSKNQNWKT